MDRMEKLLHKMNKKDLRRIREATRMILEEEVFGIKIVDQDIYRYRVGDYRILYIQEKGNNIIIDIRKRNEKTYK